MRFPLGLVALVLVLSASLFSERVAFCQDSTAPIETAKVQDVERPLPDIPTLMREVGGHQKAEEEIRKNYLYRAVETRQDEKGNGTVKKTTVNEYEVFWINGVPVQRLLKKDGKQLSPDEQKKENDRIDKDVAKARERKEKSDSKGKETGPRGNDAVTASRILELGTFSNPRRVKLDGRDTIVVDYSGDPKAKTKSRFEDVFRDLVGTVWVDEQDRVIRKTQGHFLKAFKIGGGLLVNIRQDTNFAFDQRKINGEVWLPARIVGNGSFRFLLLTSFNGTWTLQMSDYRKFKATSTILPGVSTVQEGAGETVPQ